MNELLACGVELHIPQAWWPQITKPTAGYWVGEVLRINTNMRDTSKQCFIKVAADEASGTSACAQWHHAKELLRSH